jgi:hypothetical protein
MHSFKTSDAERRSRILTLKTSKKPFGEKKKGEFQHFHTGKALYVQP